MKMEGSVGQGEPDVTYMIIMDESGSTGGIIDDVKNFLAGLVGRLFDDGSALNIGAVRFESNAIGQALVEETNADTVKTFLLEATPYGGTQCGKAFDEARTLLTSGSISPGGTVVIIFAGDGECSDSAATINTAKSNLQNALNQDVNLIIQVAAIGSVSCDDLSDISSDPADCQDVNVIEDYQIEQVIGTTLESLEFSDDANLNYVATTNTCSLPQDGPFFCEADTATAVTIGFGANEVCVKATGTAATDTTVEEEIVCMTIYGTDITPPIYDSCPAALSSGTDSGECYATVSLPGLVSPADACGGPLTETLEPSGPVFVLGGTDVLYGLIDESGNAAPTCTMAVTVEDDEEPVVDCPDNYTIETDLGTCVANNPCIPKATAIDNCEVASLTSDAPATFDTLGDKTVEWTAKDNAENEDTCTFMVTLVDNEKPSVSCELGVNPGGGSSNTNNNGFFIIKADDNCSVSSIELKDSSGYSYGTEFDGTSFSDGDKIKYTSSSSAQTIDDGSGQVDLKIKGQGNLVIKVTDGSGNTALAVCIVSHSE
jgi:hypothetical protein